MQKEIFIIDDIRTNNFNDEKIEKKIKSLWDNSMSKLDSDFNEKIYAIYSEYESDYKGDYTLAIGTESVHTAEVVYIPESKYRKFVVEGGDENILNTWRKIWELEDNGEIERAYTIDFEIYDMDKTEIYIALK